MNANNLTHGPILSKIIQLSIPIMGSSFVVMAYNITDMFWLGNVSSGAVAAVGAASFVIWFVESFLAYTKIGAEVQIAKSYGAGQYERAAQFARHALWMAIICSFLVVLGVFFLSSHIISFFQFQETQVITDAVTYLRIYSIAMFLAVPIMTLNGVYNGIGKTKIPFVINSIGMLANMVLDPLFIYTFNMKVAGAAWASVISHVIGIALYWYFIKVAYRPFDNFSWRTTFDWYYFKKIVRVGIPASIHHAAFSLISMIIARFVSQYGATAVAVQSLGAQIESITWMTAGGFSSALSTFVGQNFGAKKLERIRSGYFHTLLLSCTFGIVGTIIFLWVPDWIYRWFIPEPEAIALGALYLTIMGYSQIFMSLEITTAGAFNGLGKTAIPSIVGIGFTAARIPMALLLMPWLGLPGIWWSITLSASLKGIVLSLWFILWQRRQGIEKLWIREGGL